MVRGRHNEFGARGNGAELADYQLLGAGCVEYVPGLEESRVVRVVVVGEFSDLDFRRGHQRLQEDRVFFLVVDHFRPVDTYRVRDRAHVYAPRCRLEPGDHAMFVARGCASAAVDSHGPLVDSVLTVGYPAPSLWRSACSRSAASAAPAHAPGPAATRHDRSGGRLGCRGFRQRGCRCTVSVTVVVRWPTKRAMFSSGIKARRPVA